MAGESVPERCRTPANRPPADYAVPLRLHGLERSAAVAWAGGELTIIVDNVKLFCSKCEEREMFSPVRLGDLTNEGPRLWGPPRPHRP
jgi:hypothetical protein